MPITSLLNGKNKEGSLHCMLADCSRWDAACAAKPESEESCASMMWVDGLVGVL